MISKNKYKFLNVFLYLFILIILNFPHEGHAQIFLSEDWDSGTPPTDWPCKNFPNAYTTNTFHGWAPKNYDLNTFGDAGRLSGLSTTIYHSPPRSYYQHRPANNYATCDIVRNLSQPYPTKIHVRFYIYFTSNWSNFDNPPTTTGEVVHLILLNFVSAGSGFYFDIWDSASLVWPYKCSYATTGMWPQMYFIVQSNTTPGGNDTAPDDCYNLSQHLNEWISVEFMADAANDRFSMWINGNQKVNNVYMSISQSDFNRIMISGWNSILRNYTGDFYIDDIVVSDSYIGPIDGSGGGGDTPPPSSGGDTSSSSGGSGCGFVKDDGKGPKAKGEGLALIIMLIITLAGIALGKKVAIKRRMIIDLFYLLL